MNHVAILNSALTCKKPNIHIISLRGESPHYTLYGTLTMGKQAVYFISELTDRIFRNQFLYSIFPKQIITDHKLINVLNGLITKDNIIGFLQERI